jgi:hypothetical protein
MSELDDALEVLRGRLPVSAGVSDIVAEIAEDYGLHPAFLRRKFEERFKTSPESYERPTSLVTLDRRAARKGAISWAWQADSFGQGSSMGPEEAARHSSNIEAGRDEWISERVRAHHLGAIFKEQGREYAFIGLSASKTIEAIPVQESDQLSAVLWMTGNSELGFETEALAYEWLEGRIIVGAQEDLI